MEPTLPILRIIALTLGLSWASGINLYAAMLTLGLLGASGQAVLPPGLEILTHPLVLAASGLMYGLEFFADKVPGVDTGWDLLHSFIRIPAAAVLAAAASMQIGPAAQVAAGIIGGGLAASSHLTKASGRILINASPEPFSNSLVSLGEDAVVVAGMWTALNHPLAFVLSSLVLIAGMIWILPKLWRGVRCLWRKLRFWKRPQPPVPVSQPVLPPDRTPASRSDP